MGAMLQGPPRLNIDGSLVPLGSTAPMKPVGIEKSLWARSKSLDVIIK